MLPSKPTFDRPSMSVLSRITTHVHRVRRARSRIFKLTEFSTGDCVDLLDNYPNQPFGFYQRISGIKRGECHTPILAQCVFTVRQESDDCVQTIHWYWGNNTYISWAIGRGTAGWVQTKVGCCTEHRKQRRSCRPPIAHVVAVDDRIIIFDASIGI